MNRIEWKALHKRMRETKRAADSSLVYHGGTYWTVHFFRSGSDRGLHLCPSIIRDRSTSSRVADSLHWSRRYRLEAVTHKRNGSYWQFHASRSVAAGKACITECRDIRANASRFHELESAA